MTSDSAPRQPFYRNRDYLLLVSAQGLSLTGRQIESLVLPLLVLGLTGSPVQVGLIAAVQTDRMSCSVSSPARWSTAGTARR